MRVTAGSHHIQSLNERAHTLHTTKTCGCKRPVAYEAAEVAAAGEEQEERHPDDLLVRPQPEEAPGRVRGSSRPSHPDLRPKSDLGMRLRLR